MKRAALVLLAVTALVGATERETRKKPFPPPGRQAPFPPPGRYCKEAGTNEYDCTTRSDYLQSLFPSDPTKSCIFDTKCRGYED